MNENLKAVQTYIDWLYYTYIQSWISWFFTEEVPVGDFNFRLYVIVFVVLFVYAVLRFLFRSKEPPKFGR